MQWQVVMVAVFLFVGIFSGIAELRRRRKPEQQRIAEAEQRFFAQTQPKVEVDLTEANLKREALTRLALQHGYELERAEKRGSPGSLSSIKYHFVLRGPEAKPAPFLPESHEYEAYKRWETARDRKIRLFYAKFYGALIVIVGVLVVLAVRCPPRTLASKPSETAETKRLSFRSPMDQAGHRLQPGQ